MNLNIFLLFIICGLCESSKILFIHPSFSRSHVLPMQELAKGLAERGHEITFITVFPLENPPDNYRQFKVEMEKDDFEYFDLMTKSMMSENGVSFFKLIKGLTRIFFKYGNLTLQSDYMQKLKNEEQFDVVIVGYFLTEYLIGLADHFKCPSIVFFSGNHMAQLNKMVGNPLSPSGTPHVLSGGKNMNFIGRVVNFLVNGADLFLFTPFVNYKSREIYNDNFPPERYRSYDEMLRNVSLVLINTHFTSSGPRPNLPNMVEVGGLQINPTINPLPNNIQKFLDEATNGAILFSLGSNAKSIYIAEDKINSILKVFSKLKQRVIMKWESDVLPNKPDNVLISKWLPQNDVLAHPNMKLFISHCGYGGIVEAQFNGVPILGIPLGGDQTSNAERAVQEGWAVRLDLIDLNEKSLMDAVNKILRNPKYTNIVKEKSILSRDRPMSAQDTAVYWVEYILRHKGAPHLHYPGADLNFLQDNSIDVMLFIAVVLYSVWKILKLICCAICCRGRKKQNQKLKKN